MPEEQSRKVRHVKVTFDADRLAMLFISEPDRAFGVSMGMPLGSVLVDLVYDYKLRRGVAVFYHPDFPEADTPIEGDPGNVPYVKMEWIKYAVEAAPKSDERVIKLFDARGRKVNAKNRIH